MKKGRWIIFLMVISLVCLAAPAFAKDTFKVSLMPCTVDLCGVAGTATLAGGRIDVKENGTVEVELEGTSLVSKQLTVSFLSVKTGSVEVEIGKVDVDASGNCDRAVGKIPSLSDMGAFFVSDGAVKQFVTGFTKNEDLDDDCIMQDGTFRNDHDCDGIADADDPDDDNDGTPDVNDTDDDNDGILDDNDPNDSMSNRFDDNPSLSDTIAEFRAEKRRINRNGVNEIEDIIKNQQEDRRMLRRDFRNRINKPF